MTVIGKVVALVVSIALFAMPAMTMSFHCVLMTGSVGNPDHCHMREMNSASGQKSAPADHPKAPPANHTCCQASVAIPESIAAPRALADSGIVAPPASAVFSELPAGTQARVSFDWETRALAGPPQAVLCTFLI